MSMKDNSVCDKRYNKCIPIKGAMHNGGLYVGSPGKDIYLMLPYLSKIEMKQAASVLAKKFPHKPLKTNVNVAACIRFVYGQWAKQGSLRSDEDFKRMKKEKPNWSLSRDFLRFLRQELKKIGNFYGLTILYEMEAHRLGDEAVLNKNQEKLGEMEDIYRKAIKYADKCNSYKHMFSLYYWASQYFIKFGDVEKSVKYSKKTLSRSLKYYHKYFPLGDAYYSSRLGKIFLYVKKNDGIEFCKKIRKKAVHSKLVRVFKNL